MSKSLLTWPLLALMLLSAVGLSSCRTYEDGPSFSLRSKTERVSNNWVAGRLFRNDIDETNFYELYGMEFQRNGAFIWRVDRNDDTDPVVERTGEWQLTAANTMIEMTFTEPDPITEQEKLFLEVRRLTEDEMWVEFIYRENSFDIQFQ